MLLYRFTYQRFLFNTDEGGGGGGEPAPETTATPQAAPEASASPTGSATPSAWSLRDVATAKYGIPGLDRFRDDDAALEHLMGRTAQIASQAQQYRTFYEQAAPEWSEYQRWKESQKQAAQQAAQPAKAKWEHPEYNARWETMVQRDPETGRLVPVDGADPSLPSKIANYKNWQRETLEKFLQNPVEMLYPHLEDRIGERVTQALEEYKASIAPKQYVNDLIRQNEDWMYQHDQYGRKIVGDRGLPVWSDAGQAFHEAVKEIEQMLPGATHEQITNLALRQTEMLIKGQQRTAPQAAPVDPRQTYAGVPPVQPTNRVAAAAASAATADDNNIPQNRAARFNLGQETINAAKKAGLIAQGAAS